MIWLCKLLGHKTIKRKWSTDSVTTYTSPSCFRCGTLVHKELQ